MMTVVCIERGSIQDDLTLFILPLEKDKIKCCPMIKLIAMNANI